MIVAVVAGVALLASLLLFVYRRQQSSQNMKANDLKQPLLELEMGENPGVRFTSEVPLTTISTLPDQPCRSNELQALASSKEVAYDFLVTATDNWRSELGQGAFATVFIGEMGGKQVAVKLEKTNEETAEPNFARLLGAQFESEIEILYTHSHPNICALLAHSEADPVAGRGRALVYEYCVNGCLYDRIQNGAHTQIGNGTQVQMKNAVPALTWEQRVQISIGTARGLAFLHSGVEAKQIIHRDVKTGALFLFSPFSQLYHLDLSGTFSHTANILLDGQMQPKVGDYQIAVYAVCSIETGRAVAVYAVCSIEISTGRKPQLWLYLSFPPALVVFAISLLTTSTSANQVADFGTVRENAGAEKGMTHISTKWVVGTNVYMPIEYTNFGRISIKVCVFTRCNCKAVPTGAGGPGAQWLALGSSGHMCREQKQCPYMSRAV
jgi:serine/threonine protein kinase